MGLRQADLTPTIQARLNIFRLLCEPNKMSWTSMAPVRACVLAKSLQACPTLCDLLDCPCQAPWTHRTPRREHRSGLPCLPPGDLSDSGIEPMSPVAPALARPLSHLGIFSTDRMREYLHDNAFLSPLYLSTWVQQKMHWS